MCLNMLYLCFDPVFLVLVALMDQETFTKLSKFAPKLKNPSVKGLGVRSTSPLRRSKRKPVAPMKYIPCKGTEIQRCRSTSRLNGAKTS